MLQLKPQVNAMHAAHLERLSSVYCLARGNVVVGSVIL